MNLNFKINRKNCPKNCKYPIWTQNCKSLRKFGKSEVLHFCFPSKYRKIFLQYKFTLWKNSSSLQNSIKTIKFKMIRRINNRRFQSYFSPNFRRDPKILCHFLTHLLLYLAFEVVKKGRKGHFWSEFVNEIDKLSRRRLLLLWCYFASSRNNYFENHATSISRGTRSGPTTADWKYKQWVKRVAFGSFQYTVC